MILAINTNAALDRVYFLTRLQPAAHNRTEKSVLSVGGKGLDSAVVLQAIGAPCCAISFMAGKNGQALAELLEQRRIPSELIWLPGETRESIVIVETEHNRHTHITSSGYSVGPDDCAAFLAKVDELAPAAKWAVMAGTLPPGAPVSFYRELTGLHRQGVKVLIDAFGAPLLEALPAVPEIVKMNQAEFAATFQAAAEGLDAWIRAGLAQVEARGLQSLVITCGKEGILAFTPQGVYHAGAPELKAVNAAGAGDAVSAALAYHLSLGKTWSEALQWAAATGAAVVLTEGTAECDPAEVTRLYPQAWVKLLQQPEKDR